MCRFDGRCENQDRNMECACYAREQTLRAEQYSNLIDRIGNQNLLLKAANAELREQLEILRGKNVAHKSAKALNKIKKLNRS